MADEQGKEQPIIIKKKRKHDDHGAHGGAWKVAYADFVTAMMAFFIVMWILGQSEDTKKAVAGYFKDPGPFEFMANGDAIIEPVFGSKAGEGSAGKKGEGDNSKASGSGFAFINEGAIEAAMKNMKAKDSTMTEEQVKKALQDSIKATERLKDLSSNMEKLVRDMIMQHPELDEILNSIKIEMTKEGLRIELIENGESVFFEVGSDKLKPQAKNILSKLAEQIGQMPNNVELEGHTDSRGYGKKTGYTNWELSSDRANASRRYLEQTGLWEGQVVRCSGFADKKLRNASNPFSSENRRISILLRNMNAETFLQNKPKE